MHHGGTQHFLRLARRRDDEGRGTFHGDPLRPRNRSVPAYRPPQRGGCRGQVRQVGTRLERGAAHRNRVDQRQMCWSSSGRPINAPGSGTKASRRLCGRRRQVGTLPERDRRLLPLVASAASGSPAALPSPRKHGGRAQAVVRCNMSYTARAHVWARTVNALPVLGFFSKRGRDFWPAGLARTKSPAAAATAHGREACPIVVPEVPSRFPAASLAHVTKRQEDTQSCTRGKRWMAWIS